MWPLAVVLQTLATLARGRPMAPVVLPPYFSFFLGAFAGAQGGLRHHLRRPDWLTWQMRALWPTVERLVQEEDAVLREFPYHQPWSSLQQQTNSAEAAVHLTRQYGEGWLLAGEVGLYARHGIRNVVCLQPFGCIANHVIAKGVARRMTETNPGLKLAFLDLYAGMSEISFFNRLHFFADQAKHARVP